MRGNKLFRTSDVILILVAFSTRAVMGTIQQYWEMVNLRTYVDKTLLIKHFFNGPDDFAIIAPRFFAKSTNLNMLKAFLEIETGPDGNEVRQNLTRNFQAFASNNLKIFQDKEFFTAHFAKYPVMCVDFGEISATTRQNFYSCFHHLVRKLYNRFVYLSESKSLVRSERKAFNEILQTDHQPDEQRLTRSGAQLADFLFKHHGERLILLIDNYDTPIKNAMMSKDINNDDTISMVKFLTQFIEQLIVNKERVRKSLFTGCLRVGEIYTLKSNTTKTVSIFQDMDLSDYYGFTECDVETLVAKLSKKSNVNELRKRYGGYYLEGTHKLLYNPNSIVRYLETGKLENYFELSKELRGLEPFFDFERMGEMGEGTIGEDVLIIPHPVQSTSKLLYLKNMFCGDEWSVFYIHRMVQFFMELGYYTASSRIPNEIVGDAINIGFPNEETRDDFRKLVFTPIFYVTKFLVSNECMDNFVHSIKRLSPQRITFEALAMAVEGVFYNRKPVDTNEFAAVLHALAVESETFLQVGMVDSGCLVLIREKNVGVVLGVALVKSSAKMVLSRIVENTMYDTIRNKAKRVILIGLYMNSLGQCDVAYLYDKFSLADRQTAAAPRTTPVPKTTTLRARFTWPKLKDMP